MTNPDNFLFRVSREKSSASMHFSLYIRIYICYWLISTMNRYSTPQAAEKLGLSLMTLNRYLAAGKIPAPPVQLVGKFRVRLWSDSDIEKVRKTLPKIANGRKTRHQKQKKDKQGKTDTKQ